MRRAERKKLEIVRGDVISTAIRRIRSRCCARAASGHAAAAPPSSVMNSRRLIQSPRRRWQARQVEWRCRTPWPS